MEISYLKKLAQMGYSIIPVSEDKRPIGAWKKYQEKPRTEEEVEKLTSPKSGLVCGIDGLEVIDVDLKVFPSLKEQQFFWNEYISFLKDNIEDFDDKFVIKKTKNKGYHILYKCREPQGSTKIACLEGHTEAVIESRGLGGMVVMYEDSINNKNYHQIQQITDDERNILWECSKFYNYVSEKNNNAVIEHGDLQLGYSKKEGNNKEGKKHEKLAFEDYDEKVSIFDVISDDFDIVRNLDKLVVIRRKGAQSPHSGYVYKNSGCMYLFSTATIYPHEKLISPSLAYAYKHHNGDLKKASLDLYKQGYGTRSKDAIEEIESSIEEFKDYKIEIDKEDFPIDVFPESIQTYLMECHKKLDGNLDYMGSSLLWLMSVMLGNAVHIEVKKGWVEPACLWVCVVGRAGIGKTPSINHVIHPLEEVNKREVKRYLKEREEYDQYDALSKKEKEEYPEVKKPIKKQFIANDITIEALVDLHQESDNSVGVFKDELAGWLKDMNKYRAGSDLEFWLSSWSGKSVYLNRITRAGSFVDRPFIPVLGGIQPTIFSHFYTEENKENGFMDRMLLCYPDAKITPYNENEISQQLLLWYKESIISVYDQITNLIERDEDGVIIPELAVMSKDAKKEWIRIFEKISAHQNNEEENEYLKSMYPKQKSYIPRFALIINMLEAFFDSTGMALEISKSSILKAEKLSDYFINNAKRIKIHNIERDEMKTMTKKIESKYDKIKALYGKDKDFNRTKVAEFLEVSVQYVRKVIREIEAKKQEK